MADFDSGYKLLFSHPELVADLLRGFVPEPWVAEVDFTTLTPVKGSYVSEGLRQRHDDVVWKVRLREQWLYVYVVIEFQSEPDPFMALRLLVYVGTAVSGFAAAEGIAGGRAVAAGVAAGAVPRDRAVDGRVGVSGPAGAGAAGSGTVSAPVPLPAAG